MLSIVMREITYKLLVDDLCEVLTKQFDVNDDLEVENFSEREDIEVIEDEYVDVPLPASLMLYINVYYITREYGGSEEGGWWYNRFECVECIPCRNEHSDTMMSLVNDMYKDHSHGNIYSVRGGREVAVIAELKPKQSETKERPYYE